jgi:polyphosphate kinase
MFPILDDAMKSRIMADLDTYLADNLQAWELRASGQYVQLAPTPGSEPLAAQATLLRQLSETSQP